VAGVDEHCADEADDGHLVGVESAVPRAVLDLDAADLLVVRKQVLDV
ncbi:MAG: hypothetical protein QOD58_1088, partial [Mycobacterium sp.]|nr:hypothetical protein [Mycobacterium sp.]